MKRFFSFVSLLSLLINLVLPYAVYAQEATPVSTPVETSAPAEETSADPAEPATSSTEPSPVVSSEPSTVSSADPSAVPSPEPSASPSAPVAPETVASPEPVVSPEPSVVATPSAQPSPSAAPTPSVGSVWNDLNGSFETTNNVVRDVEYTAPQNDKVKIKFTGLPDASGKITVKEVKLTADEITQTGALSDTAYEITSTMQDGTFFYDLTLPIPASAQNQQIEVKSSETKEDIETAQKLSEPKEKVADEITIHGLDHFTVFVVTTPSSDTAQRVMINEVLPNPAAGAEWVELFNNGTQAVNLGAGTGWTIRNSAGSSQSLSALGTIPAAGRVVFDAPAGWLSNTGPETITISNELGTSVDTVTISLTAPGFAINHYPLAGESVGRRSDGVATWFIFAVPTRGTANALPAAGGAGSLSEAGPISTTTTFPSWFKDSNGLKLDLMPASDANGISEAVEAGNAFSSQIGFGAEGFWWSAEADIATSGGQALLVQAIEATFNTAGATDGEQAAFARVRIRIDVTDPGTYTVIYPYGTKTYNVVTPGIRAINDTVDIGCFSTPAVRCDAAVNPYSQVLGGGIGPFLTWDTFNTNPALTDPALNAGGRRYVGTVATPHAVTGSPTGNNFFRVSGPNIGGPGVNQIQTNLFTVTGRLADAVAPVITLHGSNPVNVNQNATYTDAGATALDDIGGNLTGSIVVTGLPLDTSALGPQTVTYTVTDSAGRTTSATRTVNVVAAGGVDTTAPVITRTGASPVSVVAGTPYVDAGATALDNTDGDLTASIVTTGLPVNTSATGTFTVTYNVSDAAGNPATAVTRTVNVIADAVAPVITVTGSNPVNVFTGSTYTDAGATCIDNVAGNCTAGIVTTGLPISTAVPGTFTVTYTFTDAAGNAGSASRTVSVANTLPAGLVAVGPVSATTTFPSWFKDSAGLSLDLMPASDTNSIAAPVAGGNAFSSQIGFGEEAFWWSADSSVATSGPIGALLVMAVEAAFPNAGDPLDGDQAAFARVRVRIDVGEPGTYVVTFPYGTRTYNVTSVGAGYEINDTSDIGCFSAPGLRCDAAVSPFSEVLTGEIGPFLTWDTFNTNAALSDPLLFNTITGKRYLGNPNTAHAVAGSPTGNNFFRITGPNIGGAGVNQVQSNLFTVSGRLADAAAPVITVNGANPAAVAVGATYTDAGATATDDFDGTVAVVTTGLPVNTGTAGARTVTYTATDRSGNSSTAQRTVNVGAVGPDVIAPVITLTGAASVSVAQGATYTDAGATALDNTDGNITSAILTTGLPVNTSIAGPVTITYNVSDAAGNAATAVTRTVTVVAATPVVTAITVTPANPTVAGTTQTFTAPAVDQFGNAITASPVFTTTNPGVGTINPATGVFTATGEGTTTVIATAGTVTNSTIVTVQSAQTIITITPTATTFGIGENGRFEGAVTDQFGALLNNSITFSSSNPAVGTVNAATGEFTAISAGTTNIRATSGAISTVTSVTVAASGPAGELRSVNVTAPTSIASSGGSNIQLTSTPQDRNGVTVTGATLSFVSSNTGVATVSGSGLITTVNPGKATIRVTAVQGGIVVKKDFRITVERVVAGTALNTLVTDLILQPAAGALPGATPSVTVAQPLLINVAGANGRTHKIRIPAGTVITRIDGAFVNANSLSATIPAEGDISGFLSGASINGLLQWGIPNIGLNFSGPVTIDVNVGTEFNGQTLNVSRSTNGNSAWTTDGVSPTTCAVADGFCSFQITKASFFATYAMSQTSSSSSSGASSGSGNSAPTCSDVPAGGAPVLLSAAVSGDNEVKLTWSKAADPVTHYVVVYGLEAGKPLFGNPNVGGKDTTSYTVKNLSGNTTYFFQVRAGNGCNAGEYSNEIAATPGGAVIAGPAEDFEEGVLGTGTGGLELSEILKDGKDAEVLGDDSGNVGIGFGDLGKDGKAGKQSFTGFLGTQKMWIGVLAVLILLYILNRKFRKVQG